MPKYTFLYCLNSPHTRLHSATSVTESSLSSAVRAFLVEFRLTYGYRVETAARLVCPFVAENGSTIVELSSSIKAMLARCISERQANTSIVAPVYNRAADLCAEIRYRATQGNYTTTLETISFNATDCAPLNPTGVALAYYNHVRRLPRLSNTTCLSFKLRDSAKIFDHNSHYCGYAELSQGFRDKANDMASRFLRIEPDAPVLAAPVPVVHELEEI